VTILQIQLFDDTHKKLTIQKTCCKVLTRKFTSRNYEDGIFFCERVTCTLQVHAHIVEINSQKPEGL